MKKLIYPITAIICCVVLGASFMFVQINKQNSIERQQQLQIEREEKAEQAQIEREEKAKEAKKIEEQLKLEAEETKKKEARQALDNCLANEHNIYSEAWSDKCEELGKLSNECINLRKMTVDEYIDTNLKDDKTKIDLIFEYYDKKKECSCSLFEYQYKVIEERYEKGKDECFKKNPL